MKKDKYKIVIKVSCFSNGCKELKYCQYDNIWKGKSMYYDLVDFCKFNECMKQFDSILSWLSDSNSPYIRPDNGIDFLGNIDLANIVKVEELSNLELPEDLDKEAKDINYCLDMIELDRVISEGLDFYYSDKLSKLREKRIYRAIEYFKIAGIDLEILKKLEKELLNGRYTSKEEYRKFINDDSNPYNRV